MDKLKLGISSCLLGEEVRYDGGHKLDRFLRDQLGRFVEYVPVCPEVECGMPVPREAMRLVGSATDPRLTTRDTGVDKTEMMEAWIPKVLERLGRENLCGFVFKSKSPSSGMRDVKVYPTASGTPVRKGVGIFARAFMDRFPLVPVEDEGRLQDDCIRENFIERVFIYKRWIDLCSSGRTLGGLVRFHAAHKLILMAHSPSALKKLGGMVALGKKAGAGNLYRRYAESLFETLKRPSTVSKNTNVLYHMIGYFRKLLAPEERAELIEILERYHNGYVPLVVPITLINHYVKKHQIPYLLDQYYLNPHPYELMLRNHV